MQHITQRRLRRLAAAGAAIALGTAGLAACSGSTDDAGGGSTEDTYSIAVLLASSQNGYNQAIGDGVKEAAAELDPNIKITVLDGQFNADTQLAQMETAGTGDKYDGVVVVPFDGPALAAAFPLGNSIPVVTALNPIGPDNQEMQPQTEGVVSTVSTPPAGAAGKQAQWVVDYCADIDPCKVTILAGQLNGPQDISREKAYREVLEAEPNIQVVSTVEGNYDPDQSATAIGNVLQGTPDLNAVITPGDQMAEGAQIAFEDAGIDPKSVFISGGGGTQAAVQKVRDGIWKADYLDFPVSMGKAAMEQLYNQLTGKDVTVWVDSEKVAGDIDPFATKETLEQYPDFIGEWVG